MIPARKRAGPIASVLLGTRAGLLGTLLCGACAGSIGPQTIPRDRIDYGTAIARAGQEQMLTNLVKLRYADAPVFLEVASIINQYALEGLVSASAAFPGITDRDSFGVNGTARFTDRPTITYAPLSGERFVKSLLTPVRPETVFSLVQAGWPIDLVFQNAVRAINGVYNRSRTQILARAPDPEFLQVVAALRRIQSADALGLRVEDSSPQGKLLVVFRSTRVTPEVLADVHLVRELLGLQGDAQTFRLGFGAVPETDQDVVLLTRSLFEMMGELAATIEVPEEHVAERRVNPTNREQSEAELQLVKLIGIHSGLERPEEAFISILYREHWFWIDDRDFASKRAFTFLTLFFELAQSDLIPTAPLVTIGTGT